VPSCSAVVSRTSAGFCRAARSGFVGTDQQRNFPVGAFDVASAGVPGRGGSGGKTTSPLPLQPPLQTPLQSAEKRRLDAPLPKRPDLEPRAMRRASHRPLTPILARPGLDVIGGDVQHGKVWRRVSIKRISLWSKWALVSEGATKTSPPGSRRKAWSDRWHLVEASHKSCASRLNL